LTRGDFYEKVRLGSSINKNMLQQKISKEFLKRAALIIIVLLSVGIISGVVMLLSNKTAINPAVIINPVEKEVTITTDKTEYGLGEVVAITIINNFDSKIMIAWPLYNIERLNIDTNFIGENEIWDEIKRVTCPCNAKCKVGASIILARQELKYQWNQKEEWCSDFEEISNSAISGIYRIKAQISNEDGSNKKIVYSNEFTIKEKTVQNQDVSITTDKGIYTSKISADDYLATVRGEIIKIAIINNLEKDIYFKTGFVIPFSTLYFEIYKDGKWQTYNEMHGVAEYPFNFTFQKWLETATRLKPDERIIFEKNLDHSAEFNIFKGKYRFKLEYFSMPKEPEADYTKVDYATYKEETNFETVYSGEFTIKEKIAVYSNYDEVPDKYANGSYSVKGFINNAQSLNNKSFVLKGIVDKKSVCSGCPKGVVCESCAPPHLFITDSVLKKDSKYSIVINFSADHGVIDQLKIGNSIEINVLYKINGDGFSVENVPVLLTFLSFFEEKTAVDPRCGQKITRNGSPVLCKGFQTSYEFDATSGKCIGRETPACGYEIPFNSLGECQKTCERGSVSEKELIFKIIETESYPYRKEAESLVIKNLRNWTELWNSLGHSALPPEINFDEWMILAVFQGEKSTGGYSIEINKITEKENAIEISVIETSPGRGCMVTLAFTSPFQVVKVQKSDKEVVFTTEKVVTVCE